VIVETIRVSALEHAAAMHGVADLVMAFLAVPHWQA